MSVYAATVRHVAHLARIAVDDAAAERLTGELNAILGFVEQLQEVDVADVEPMTAVVRTSMKERADVVTDGNQVDAILANAPEAEDGYFLVPKVVE
jgi:aspartyl-tRNA(Asn)/glutamyl-tRNA(Gln) amidotransferase subunit C